MNRKKRNYTFLLAILLILMLALQMGIGGVFAENTKQTGQITESAEKSAGEAENAGESTEQFFYEQLMACSSLTDLEALLCAEENSAAMDALNEEELNRISAHAEEIYTAIAEPTEADTILKEKLLKKLNEYTGATYKTYGEPAETDKPAEPKKAKAAAAKAAEPDEYIYFDLALGNVTIAKDSYSGKIYANGSKEIVSSDTRTGNEKFYVYQSNTTDQTSAQYYTKTGYKTQDDWNNKQNCRVPSYRRVEHDGKKWTKYITNNADVYNVSQNWDTAAPTSDRESTSNFITFASESDYTADVIIDNIWSTYRDPNSTIPNRTTGGITANLKNTGINCNNTHIQLRLKGDNRISSVHYSAGKKAGNTIEFNDGETGDTPGSITVADFSTNWDGNRWNAVIGGADNPAGVADQSDGIVINSGVIYAGATWEDNCTAIGGGGNDYGGVTINNGTVTAVTAGTGTAIGGGIGYSNAGGDTDVTINDGTIYAYNLGIDKMRTGGFDKFVPSAAIGGGGSNGEAGGLNATINITGGTIYAQSMGGPGIGGGGSANSVGGPATINITGGTVIAKSIDGTYGTDKIDPGVSIGGGTGKTGGGSVNLNISKKENSKEPILRTGSIGGGKATGKDAEGNPYKVGSAKVDISAGDITGQVIMAGGGNENCEFNMSGGRIHDTDLIKGNKITDITDPQSDIPIKYISDNGGAVFMDDENGVTNITDGTIENCHALNGGAIWMNGGTANINGGTISGNTAQQSDDNPDKTGMGGGVYLPGGNFTLDGGTISGNNAKNGGGIYLSKAPTLNGGTISGNNATENGGGLYIKDSLVTLKPAESKELYVKENKAVNGAGIYIHGSKSGAESPGGSEAEPSAQVDVITGASPIPVDAVGLLASKETKGQIHFTDNKATGNGGAVCVDTQDKKSRFELDTDHITVTGNTAANGGGVAVSNGNFTMTAGSIGENGKPNTATDGGGGVYVSGGDIWFKGGDIKSNTAANGGGAYVGGNYNMIAGEVMSNEATNNGGGIYVNDGTVTMYGGSVDSNKATENGGGMHISSTEKAALVDIFSGSVSNNKSKSGGGVSVASSSGKNIDVTVGVNCEHPNLNDENYDPFIYPETADGCGKAHNTHNNHIDNIDGNKLQHSSCPQVKGNTASENGGGFYLDSPNSGITIYCLQAQDNTATNDPDSNCMDVQGGKLQIGDEDFDIHVQHPDSGAKGNTTIEGTIMVEGGQVDVYGEMENPKFIQDVKVDVTKEQDHYLDHRIIEDGHKDYKVHYYENFKNDDGTITGLYIARQYPDEVHADISDDTKYEFTVMSSIFSRPGYKIVGWNTKPDDKGVKYEVNETYNLSKLGPEDGLGVDIEVDEDQHHDDYLLILYAIWERSGYVLNFDPNVGEGETYTGTMENQPVTMGLLDGTQKIQSNKFVRPGYEFVGWTLTPTPSDTDTVYGDGQEIRKDFTSEDGAIVPLYAKWKKCTHEGFLTYTAEDNILTQSCSKCGGHTATATLSAVNCTYDGNIHLADVNVSTNWLGNKPEISYEMAENDTWDIKDNIKAEWDGDPNHEPLHAGNYTAKITGQNQTDGEIATAQMKYEIEPVKWETPKVPQILFKVKKVGDVNQSIIEISEPQGDNIEYMIKRLDTTNNTVIELDNYKNWQKGNIFSDIPFANYYYFYAKKCADRDHLESDPSRSEAYLATGGNIVYIEKDEGIKVVPTLNDGSFEYTVSADDGYHLRNYNDNKDTAIHDSKEVADAPVGEAYNHDGITVSRVGPSDGQYTYTVTFTPNKVAYWQVTLKFSGAAKNASVSHKVTDGQVFRDFNSKETSISRDSAFTAQFTVSDYIPDEYTGQALSFSKKLPAGTTVIMKADGKYWYYKLNAAKDSLNLTEFTAMGETEKFKFDTAGTSGKIFSYQFVVDFSQVTGNYVTDNLGVSLGLTAKAQQPDSTSQSAPDIPTTGKTHISLGIKNEANFELTSTNLLGKSVTLNCNYTASEGAASIWNGRKTALVLTAPPEAPADLTLTAVVGESTTICMMNAKRQFIIPLGKMGSKEVNITLNSHLFSASEGNLELNADWYVSQSSAGKSPINGYKAASKKVAFSSKKDAVPSVRIDEADRICKPGGVLKVNVNYAGIPIGDKIIAHLQSKTTNGQYDYTGANVNISHDTNTNGSNPIQFSMGNMDKGSYRILVIVQESGANILQVPYYFVIE